jgi:hypothetical protein
MARATPCAALQAAENLIQIKGSARRSARRRGAGAGLVGFATDNGRHRDAIRGLSHRKARRRRDEPLCPATFATPAPVRTAAWPLQNPLVRRAPLDRRGAATPVD